MLRLLEQQRTFHASIMDSVVPPTPLFKSELGLAVYRNNWLEGMRKALLADYPVVAQLVGDDCFRTLAQRYVGAYPSTSGDLQDFGWEFPRFLEAEYLATSYAYIAEVARLERAIADSFNAAAPDVLTIESLATIDPAHYPTLHVDHHPSAHVIRSAAPIFAIWHAHQTVAMEEFCIDLQAGAQQVLVYRPEFEVLVATLTAADSLFIDALLRDHSLAAAVEGALSIDAAFEAARAISRLFEWKLVTGLRICTNSH